jgi:hypothetical protein
MTDNVVKMMQSPPQLLQQAIASGAGIEVIERLLAMQERWEATQARKSFNAAIAAFKSNPPEILKTVTVSFGGGKTSYKHEDLAELLAAVDPALAAHGLWTRFKVDSTNNVVTVICVIGHADGYSEEASKLSAAPDTSGSKNPIQAIGSAVSYLQRYTLKAALGLAAAKDDDGLGAGKRGDVITEEQANNISQMLLDHPHIKVEKFLELASAQSISDIMAVKYPAAMQYLKRNMEKKAAKE